MKKILIALATLITALSLCACHQHDWKNTNCEDPKVCAECGATKNTSLEHNWKEATCSSPKLCLNCGIYEGDVLEHAWKDATCTTPKTCSICGKKQGALASHDWKAATCVSPKTCSVCGETEGTVADHSWKNATCTSPKICSTCGETEGAVANHNWKNATCISPKICSSCGKTEGSVTNHSWRNATCTSPKTCSTCGKKEGSVISHNWKNATCTTPKTCSACGKTEGSSMGHSWKTINVYTKQCKICGAKEIDQSKRPKSLGSLTPCSGGKYYSSADRKDIYGNDFSEGLVFSLFKESIYKIENERSTEYVLNRAYRKLTATTMVDADSRDNFEGRLRIYVDDVLVFDSGTITKKSQPINIEIDISNAVFIKVYATCDVSASSTRGYIMLADPTLHH